jgi:hypothetical protein
MPTASYKLSAYPKRSSLGKLTPIFSANSRATRKALPVLPSTIVEELWIRLTRYAANGLRKEFHKYGSGDCCQTRFYWCGTALHAAIATGNLNKVKLLLICGASTGARDPGESSALTAAARAENYDIVKLLLEQERVDVDSKDN